MKSSSRFFVILSACAVLALSGQASPAAAADAAVHPEKQDWSFTGLFGTYDRASLQRGYQVYKQVCASCHSMNRVYFRDLATLGYTEGQIKTVASEYMVPDGPNDEGEMFERPARASDPFKAPFANKKAATYANNGAYPPDLSLITKARHGGADYIYALLTGYEAAPEGTTLLDGQHWNKYMPGHIIAMAAPLAEGVIAYEDGTEGTVDQYARDVSHFLAWAGEPHMEARKRIGIKAFLFILAFTIIMYNVKKKIWKNVH